jgi:hypothetical protein
MKASDACIQDKRILDTFTQCTANPPPWDQAVASETQWQDIAEAMFLFILLSFHSWSKGEDLMVQNVAGIVVTADHNKEYLGLLFRWSAYNQQQNMSF